MTTPTEDITSGPYSGNDVATSFDYDFTVDDKTHLAVYETDDDGAETLLVVDTDYTITGVGDEGGGQVIRVAGALPTGYEWYIRSDAPYTQETAFSSQGGFFPDVHESAFDYLTRLVLQTFDTARRGLRLSDSSSATVPVMDDPEPGKYLKVSDDGTRLEFSSGTLSTLATQTEVKTLVSGQVVVDFTNATTLAAFYVMGADVDQGRLEAGQDFTIDNALRRVTLTNSYPAGSRLVMVYYEGEVNILNVDASEVTYTPAGTGAVATNVETKLRQTVSLEDFGVTSGLSADASANSTAIAVAFTELESAGGGVLSAPAQYYVFDSEISVPSGVKILGSGVGLWDTAFPSVAKTWEGTNFVFSGTGSKTRSYRGITSMKEAGGWREDPDNPGEYIKLTSLMNSDAVGATAATAKEFSAAVVLDHGAQLEGIRVVPWFGTDGVSDYSNQSSAGLSDEWDVGVLRVNSNGARLVNCQVVGHWRIAGALDITPDFDEFGRSERGVNRDCIFEGVTGFATRAGDVWNVEAATTTTLDIYWTDEHYWPTSGQFRGNDGVFYSYTGLSFSSPNLQFTGVTPDCSSLSEIRNPKTGSGFAGDHAENCTFYALDHVNGTTSESNGLPIAKTHEISGFPLRGQRYYNCKGQTSVDRCVGFFHDCEDIRWTDGQFEGDAFLVASPFEADSSATSPRGATKNLRLLSTLISSAVDQRLFTPRSLYEDYTQFSDEFAADLNTRVRPRDSSTQVIVEDNGGNDFMSTEIKTWVPEFAFVTAPTYTTQSGFYHQIGPKVDFTIELDWTGLDTADVSSIQILLPTGTVIKNITGTVQDKNSTGINLSTAVEHHLDILSNRYLIIGNNGTSQLTYNGGQIAASGKLLITGTYWVDS